MRRHKIVLAAYIAIAAFSLWLRTAVPVFAIGYAMHDDLLFVRLAYQLGAGTWLGPYDNLTLAKGMAYPAFILASFLASMPLKTAEQAAYLTAAGLVAWLMTKLTGRRCLALLLFVCLAFNPVLWTYHLARVVREGLYVSLSFALLVLVATVVLPRWGETRARAARLVLLIAVGLVGGVYWLTREEGLWIAPALAVLLVGAAHAAWRGWQAGRYQRRLVEVVVRAAGAGAVVVVAFLAVVVPVATMNYVHYGIFATNELRTRSFLAAYGAMARIRHDQWRRYVLFPKDARERAYAVSAAARELRPTFEGETGEGWRRIGCDQTRTTPCPDILAGWFMWAFRDAVAAAGHYAAGGDAIAFYRRLAAEINVACDDRRIPCLPYRATLAPPFRWHYLGDALAAGSALYRALTHVGAEAVVAPPSVGPLFLIDLFADLVGPVTRPTPPRIIVRGTAATREPPLQIAVRDTHDEPFRAQLSTEALDNALVLLPDVGAMRFELETDCLRPTCEMVVKAGAIERGLPLSGVTEGRAIDLAALTVVIDRIVRRGDPPGIPVARERLQSRQLVVMRGIAHGYQAVVPILTILASLGVLVAVIVRRYRPRPDGVIVLALGCAAAVAMRIALLAYLEVTSFPATNLLYLAPATPFLLTFVVLGLYLATLVLVETYNTWRARRLTRSVQPVW